MKKVVFIQKFIIIGAFALSITVGCNFTKERDQLDQSTKDTIKVVKDIENDLSNYYTVKEKCAVFFAPDSVQINKMILEVGQDKFFTMADDYNNYNDKAIEFLDKKGLKHSTTKKPIIEFIKADGSKYKINLLKYNYSWGIFLFDGIGDPKKINAIDIEKEYKIFFKNN